MVHVPVETRVRVRVTVQVKVGATVRLVLHSMKAVVSGNSLQGPLQVQVPSLWPVFARLHVRKHVHAVECGHFWTTGHSAYCANVVYRRILRLASVPTATPCIHRPVARVGSAWTMYCKGSLVLRVGSGLG